MKVGIIPTCQGRSFPPEDKGALSFSKNVRCIFDSCLIIFFFQRNILPNQPKSTIPSEIAFARATALLLVERQFGRYPGLSILTPSERPHYSISCTQYRRPWLNRKGEQLLLTFWVFGAYWSRRVSPGLGPTFA